MNDPVVSDASGVIGLNGPGKLADQLGRSPAGMLPDSIDDTQACLLALGYVPERSLATVVYLALKLQRPVLSLCRTRAR